MILLRVSMKWVLFLVKNPAAAFSTIYSGQICDFGMYTVEPINQTKLVYCYSGDKNSPKLSLNELHN